MADVLRIGYNVNMSEKKDVTPFDMLKPNNKVTQEMFDQRMEICKSCDKFKQLTQRCSLCGCFMNMKTRLEGAYCPIGKW